MSDARETLLRRMPAARRYAAFAAGGGAALLIGCAAAAFAWPHAVTRSYLFAFVFWLNVSLGGFAWLMLGHVTGGEWGRTTRRFGEAAAGVLPLLAVLGVPLILGAHHLYAWADAAVYQDDPVLLHRRPWVSTPWVAGRAAVAFAAWIAIAVVLRRASIEQGRASDPMRILAIGKRMRAISQGGMIVLFATVFLLAVDWLMSLEPHWISSVFGLVVMMGQVTAAIAGCVVMLYLIERATSQKIVSADAVHDLGKLLLTSVVLWAYMSFMQYLVQWMGHTQEDIHWYLRRLHGGWARVAAALCVLHLGVPLVLLLSRPLKRSLASLAGVAGWVLLMRILDVLWTIAPAGPGETVGGVYAFDPIAFIGVGGVWVGTFVWLLANAPLFPRAYLTSGADVSGAVIGGVDG